ncbi:hypothetical protein [Aquiflexum sp.]|uniref:hypothetical protein n=1 Tax=Aquiflexum sp. TaxID=1872584 RepID=UPI00359488B7
MDHPGHNDSILHGLEEFREHLGGELTIMLLDKIGKGVDDHEVDINLYRQAVGMIKSYEKEPA